MNSDFTFQLLQFASAHTVLVIAFLAVLLALGWTFVPGAGQGGDSLTPESAVGLINREEAVVVDMRSDEEFAAGHIVDAVHLADSAEESVAKKLRKYGGRPVILVCATGQRSQKLCKTLKAGGTGRFYSLNGGMSGWRAAGLPVVKK